MNAEIILDIFQREKNLTNEIIALIQNDRVLKRNLVHYFRENSDRDFATFLLNAFITIRKKIDREMPCEDLMLACYILGLHNQIADCLKIWEAKNIDFDTYCGLDIELVLFAGLETTKKYLNEQQSKEAKELFDYLSYYKKDDDFDPTISEYFSSSNLPWYL